MDKFSKLNKPTKNKLDEDNIIFNDGIVKLIDYEDWTLIDAKDTVICIPYLIENNQFILRHEYIPTFKFKDGQEYHLHLVGGSI